MATRRRAATLVLVLLLLALAAALVTPLALVSGTAAVTANLQADRLRHRLAAESLVALLPQLVETNAVRHALDRNNRYELRLALDDVVIDALLQDDTAKLPVPLLAESGKPQTLAQALTVLQGLTGLPNLPLAEAITTLPMSNNTLTAPRWTGCFDDLFAQVHDADLFGAPASGKAWANYLSPAGHTVHAYRADAAVLDALFADLQSGLGQQIVRQRRLQAKPDLGALLAALDLPAALRPEVARRLTQQSERYSLLVRTTTDVAQQRYLVCTANSPPDVLANWEVAP